MVFRLYFFFISHEKLTKHPERNKKKNTKIIEEYCFYCVVVGIQVPNFDTSTQKLVFSSKQKLVFYNVISTSVYFLFLLVDRGRNEQHRN